MSQATKKRRFTRVDVDTELARHCSVSELDGCCGADELYHIEAVSDDVRVPVARAYGLCSSALIVFTDAVRNRNGSRLARYIRRQKLGKVTSSSVAYNDNSGNDIQAWVWAVDYGALGRWAKVNME